MMNCPCGSECSLEECCGPLIIGKKVAETPEQLMRSRYTAYATQQIEYIEKTMRAPANQDFKKEEALNWSKRVKWQGLEILNATTKKEKGFVEFIAHYFEGGKTHAMHEMSEFHFLDNQWYYVDGKKPAAEKNFGKIGRNDACPCGSGKKYKKCCLNKV